MRRAQYLKFTGRCEPSGPLLLQRVARFGVTSERSDVRLRLQVPQGRESRPDDPRGVVPARFAHIGGAPAPLKDVVNERDDDTGDKTAGECDCGYLPDVHGGDATSRA